MHKIWKEEIISMDGILDLLKRNVLLLLSTHILVVAYLTFVWRTLIILTGGFKSGPPNQSKHTSDTNLKHFFCRTSIAQS